jgi:hypothetical protein
MNNDLNQILEIWIKQAEKTGVIIEEDFSSLLDNAHKDEQVSQQKKSLHALSKLHQEVSNHP